MVTYRITLSNVQLVPKREIAASIDVDISQLEDLGGNLLTFDVHAQEDAEEEDVRALIVPSLPIGVTLHGVQRISFVSKQNVSKNIHQIRHSAVTNQVSKADLDAALAAWSSAKQTAAAEFDAWGEVLRSHQALIDSMQKEGWTYSQAKRDVDMISEDHKERMARAWQAMEERCKEAAAIAAQLEIQKNKR
ncbi:hypothetical protein I5R65_07790 [Herbaspirillum sp. AP02]|uniref:hypothetical protein n=1 Tax=unclassified Herbaspirillum TaxID=2624150 RepID=UPI0015DBB2EA|nr:MULTISPECIES: hypothetical protein [unclassified Herbaspirillum]MBG7619362.1 hypothetical protein [Herbaspirillum sp. AP02]NZD66646.1 hypothetical protein [Herbaspirillum sp. AP21]